MARPLLLLVLLVAVTAAASSIVPTLAALGGGGDDRGPKVGGWGAIQDVSDPHIQELGEWALGQAKQQRLCGQGLRFRRVVSGQQQVVAGMNYRLYVDAADARGRSAPYEALVFEQLWTKTRQLTSFKRAPRGH